MFSDHEIKAIAEKIVKLNLATPCAFLLEAHLPLCAVVHSLALAGAPLFSTNKTYQNFSVFFADRKNVEMLINELNS